MLEKRKTRWRATTIKNHKTSGCSILEKLLQKDKHVAYYFAKSQQQCYQTYVILFTDDENNFVFLREQKKISLTKTFKIYSHTKEKIRIFNKNNTFWYYSNNSKIKNNIRPLTIEMIETLDIDNNLRSALIKKYPSLFYYFITNTNDDLKNLKHITLTSVLKNNLFTKDSLAKYYYKDKSEELSLFLYSHNIFPDAMIKNIVLPKLIASDNHVHSSWNNQTISSQSIQNMYSYCLYFSDYYVDFSLPFSIFLSTSKAAQVKIQEYQEIMKTI